MIRFSPKIGSFELAFAFASRGAISSSLNLQTPLRFLRWPGERRTEQKRAARAWDDRIGTIALQVFARVRLFFLPPCFLYPGWYRFHGITAINYEGGRPKGNVVGEGRGGAGERERKKERTRAKERRAGLEKEKRRVQLALHTISTWSSAAAAVSLRENKVSLPARALALALARAREREAKGARG